MRGLALYVMSGRLQAATVAILFGLVPFMGVISGAVVALVTLRRGLKDGLQIALWALLPAALQWQLGDPSPLFLVLGAAMAGMLLRFSRSWQSTSLLILACGVLTQWLLPFLQGYLARVQTAVATLQQRGVELTMDVNGKAVAVSAQQLVDALLKYFGVYQMLLIAASMLLARYWQAALYNPGGFREEFHNLRFDWRLMALLLAPVVAGLFEVGPFGDWLDMFCLVPMLTGMAVIHKVVAQRNMGITWLILAYLLLFIAAPAFVLLGFADSVVDFRKRLAAG